MPPTVTRMPAIAPFGTWSSPIAAADVAAAGVTPQWLDVVDDAVWWAEARPARVTVSKAPSAWRHRRAHGARAAWRNIMGRESKGPHTRHLGRYRNKWPGRKKYQPNRHPGQSGQAQAAPFLIVFSPSPPCEERPPGALESWPAAPAPHPRPCACTRPKACSGASRGQAATGTTASQTSPRCC